MNDDKTSLNIHLIAIGGSGMAPFACLLQGLGHSVRGSDGPLYPPMSTLLDGAGIEPMVGWDAAHLDPQPDLVVVGNAVHRDNPEAVEAERRGLPLYSMPQALGRFFLGRRRPLVAAGTHGMTTTSSIAAWVYTDAGGDPGFLVGGVPKNLGVSFRAGGGERFVIEGDEYNCAYFDRGPKFLHYRPETLILTSVEHDHADLYATPEALLDAYGRLVELVAGDGRVIACGDLPQVRQVAGRARAPVTFYGLGEDNHLHPVGGAAGVETVAETAIPGRSGSRFEIDDPEAGRVEVVLPMAGAYNVTNALAVWAAARRDGLAAADVASALGRFQGAARRQDELGTAAGVTVVDDFAHHPTAVEKTLAGLAGRYAGRRLTVLFEPRSITAGRRFFQERYIDAFAAADRVLLAPVHYAGRWDADELLDTGRLCEDLGRRGIDAHHFAHNDEVFTAALESAEEGDVLVTMSSGSFDGMPRRLYDALIERAS